MPFRFAKLSDAKKYFDWVNDPDVRENALNSEKIQWTSHFSWFKEKLDSGSALLIFTDSNRAIGQIRFDQDGSGNYYLDYSIDKKFRGMGYGKIMVFEAIEFLTKNDFRGSVIAQVKCKNTGSLKIFQQSKFEFINEFTIDGEEVHEYMLVI